MQSLNQVLGPMTDKPKVSKTLAHARANPHVNYEVRWVPPETKETYDLQ